VDRDYAARYRELHEKHWWWRVRERYIVSRLEQFLPEGASTDILDVGCRDGLMFDVLSRFGRIEGVEIDANASVSERWADRIFVQPFDESFDPGHQYGLVLMLDALEHMSDPALSLRRAAELLQPDGIVVVTLPAFSSLWTQHDDLNAHVERFTRRSLSTLAAQSEVRIVASNYFFHWLAPVKLAVRAKELLVPPRDPYPNIPPHLINVALARLSRIEQRTISRLPVPFGSSLFAVLEPLRRYESMSPRRVG
jgi:2-polyprenyl-3-methyl-5-hydroxy-6-metoxy-1,4-benzoquinol methylase